MWPSRLGLGLPTGGRGTEHASANTVQNHKRELFARVVDDGGLMGAPLTADDIRGLVDG